MDKKHTLRKATKSDFYCFNEDNYICCKKFDALTWSSFIKDRLLKCMSLNGDAVFIADENDELISAENFCEEIQNGLIKVSRNCSDLGYSEGEKIYGSTSFSPFWDESHVIRHVWPITLEEVKDITAPVEKFLNHENNFSFIDLPRSVQRWSPETDLMVSQPEGFMDIPYDFIVRRSNKPNADPSTNQGLINLRIDLSVTNEEILVEMAKLLKTYRSVIAKTQGKKGYISVKKSDIEKLSSYKVLPHYDLRLWAAYKGLTLDDTLIIELLFGDLNDPKEFKEKQKKIYKKVFDFSYADSLASYSRSIAT